MATSMGFTFSTHYCSGKKVKTGISLGAADVSCGMEKSENNCATSKKMKPNCCKNEVKLVQNDEDYTQPLTEFDFNTDYLIAFVIAYVELLEQKSVDLDYIEDTSPPPLIKDVLVLNQSFLI
ncbi:MAG: hypothetical protein P1U41_05510 [Vicingaceae bacterium]|nr:hypothetical protein [Vicingaceae bacterium]